MSELKKGDCWYSKECECPHCGDVFETDKDSFDMEQCHKCGKEFELKEFTL